MTNQNNGATEWDKWAKKHNATVQSPKDNPLKAMADSASQLGLTADRDDISEKFDDVLHGTETAIAVKSDELSLENDKFRVVKNGLEITGDPTFDEWTAFGGVLAGMGRAVAWAVGDWINYGEDRTDWGEKYAQALDSTNFEYGTLRNYSWVCRCFPMDKRRPVPVSYHMAVANRELGVEVRTDLIDRAVAGEFTTRDDLRKEVRKLLGGGEGTKWRAVIDGEYMPATIRVEMESKKLDPDKLYKVVISEAIEE